MALNTQFDSTTRRDRVNRLAQAIVDSVTKNRRAFHREDALDAGFTELEVLRFWDDAMIEARKREPMLTEMAGDRW